MQEQSLQLSSLSNARHKGRLPILAVAALGFFALVPAAFAGAVGPFNISNCTGGGFTLSAASVTWEGPGTLPGTGCINTGAATAVTYSGGTLGTADTGNIANLLTLTVPVDNFMTFQGTTLDFVLTGFTAPSPTNTTDCASTTPGESCIVSAGSPFLLTNGGSGLTELKLSVFGTVTDGTTDNWSGYFTTQVNITPASIQSTLVADGSITATYAGYFSADAPVTTGAPEPASWTMMAAAGLFALAKAARRR